MGALATPIPMPLVCLSVCLCVCLSVFLSIDNICIGLPAFKYTYDYELAMT